ncbi:hypothetical protein ACO229_06530 [Promicromonospora sp. MS192]|uniref:hypothetical protein n=1 Tax=Promicromonospora sp. MS192 TaxID=3412684 RepID=UPI003C2FA4CA
MTTNPSSPWVLDADPVETAAAIAQTMRRLASETSRLTTVDQVPQIANELQTVLREMASVTTNLARLSFEHPTPSAPDGDLGAFTRRTPATRAADGFNDTTHLIYLACQPLAGAHNETARLTATTRSNAAHPPGSSSHPGPARREEPLHPPSL